jgi:hypothetical protein
MRCFQFLIEMKIEEKEPSCVRHCEQRKRWNEKTYWHLPQLSLGANSGHVSKRIHAVDSGSVPKTCMLMFPNGCPVEHEQIKWECRVVIDNGSGQAKLYVERDAALSLLVAGLHVHDIEPGARQIQGGLLRQKVVPPKSLVKLCAGGVQKCSSLELHRF